MKRLSDDPAVRLAECRGEAADTRAVVDEPVAWRWEWKTARENDGWCYVHQYPDAKVAHLMDIEPLYRHPQRPRVLPERKPTGTELTMRRLYVNIGFNACLDRIAELNK